MNVQQLILKVLIEATWITDFNILLIALIGLMSLLMDNLFSSIILPLQYNVLKMELNVKLLKLSHLPLT